MSQCGNVAMWQCGNEYSAKLVVFNYILNTLTNYQIG